MGTSQPEKRQKMLGIARLTVNRYLAKGILTGEQQPITHYRRIYKESVLALMVKMRDDKRRAN